MKLRELRKSPFKIHTNVNIHLEVIQMHEDVISKLKGIAAIMEYMSGADKLDVNYTKEALGILSENMYEIIEEIKTK